MKQFIATSISTFKELREKKALYIDKTEPIYNLLKDGEKYFFLSRPRRFGKSLLCSTLAELFSGNRELFKGLWIDGSDWKWNKHPVIYLDMTDAAGQVNSSGIFRRRICTQLKNIARAHNITIGDFDFPAEQLTLLIESLHQKYGFGIAIIIDEYDKPVLDLVDNSVACDEIHKELASFYAPLKSKGALLSLVFMTGVYKVSKTSIFSNLNNLKDLTFDPLASSLVGYTQEELESYFSDGIDLLATKKQVTRTQMLATLREQYNGYKFGLEKITGQLSPSVYNSFAMNHVFAANDLVEKWFTSGSPSFLIQKIKAGNFELVSQEGVSISFSTLDESCGPDKITAVSLLYYAGYATLSSYNPDSKLAVLMPPNSEVREAMAGHLVDCFRKATATDLEKIAWDITQCFRLNTLDELQSLLNQALAQVTYQVLESEEKYFQLMLHLLLTMGRLENHLEAPTNNGRMDITIELPTRIFIIELKFDQPAQDGLNQIVKKKYMTKYLVRGLPIIGLGISFALQGQEKRAVVDLAWQELELK